MKEGQMPSPEEMKKTESMMSEEQKHESAVREEAVKIGEKQFDNYSENKKFSPEESAQAERDNLNEKMREMVEKVNQMLQTASEEITNISEVIDKKALTLIKGREGEISETEISEMSNDLLNWAVGLTESIIIKFNKERKKITNSVFKDMLDSVETVSDFVIHKKKEILKQETDENKKQEMIDSISASENAKKIRIKEREDYLETVLISQEKWVEKILKEYQEVKKETF